MTSADVSGKNHGTQNIGKKVETRNDHRVPKLKFQKPVYLFLSPILNFCFKDASPLVKFQGLYVLKRLICMIHPSILSFHQLLLIVLNNYSNSEVREKCNYKHANSCKEAHTHGVK